MRFDILTLFPDTMNAIFSESILSIEVVIDDFEVLSDVINIKLNFIT